MLCFPNAKINLGLHVTGERSDGYHNIETVFYPVPLCDIFEIIKQGEKTNGKNTDVLQSATFNKQVSIGKIQFSASGILVEGDAKNNLCVKAFELLDKDFDFPPVKMHLHKIIPTGAGLGGGSSDAAFTVKLLNDVFELNISEQKMRSYAEQLGSDCSFFISDKPAFATGRGEVLHEVQLSLQRFYLIIVKPPVHVSTADAYANVHPQKPSFNINILPNVPVQNWKFILFNDFEKTVFQKFPRIKTIKEKLYSKGALYASMSGSGSAVFGIFEHPPKKEIIFNDCFVWKGIL